jgi:hypothetical protein
LEALAVERYNISPCNNVTFLKIFSPKKIGGKLFLTYSTAGSFKKLDHTYN